MGKGHKNIAAEPPADSLELFQPGNPNESFKDLHLIGHGNFGSVYQATDNAGRTIAVKLINLPKGYSGEEWTDVRKEITTLSNCSHRNILKMHCCFREKLSVWLILEYCIGSAVDLMDLFRVPFSEDEVAVITMNILQALEYIHAMGWIHRDIKGGNILLTDSGEVKLGDFGSSSQKSSANSFVGSPYWMAPEVISAMEDGTYSNLVDIWSLGITCIELAEIKPPLFDKHAMSALYQIVQRPSPTLQDGKGSANFVSFLDSALKKDASERLPASQLLQHPWVQSHRPADLLFTLVTKAKSTEVRTEREDNVNKVIEQARSLVVTSSSEIELSKPDLPAIPEDDDPDLDIPLASTSTLMDTSFADLPPPPDFLRESSDDDVLNQSVSSNISSSTTDNHELGAEFFSKVPEERDRKISTELDRVRSVRQEQAHHHHAENKLVEEQLKEIQWLQKDEERVMSAMRLKHNNEMLVFRTAEAKEQDQMIKAQEKELERILARHAHESEAYLKTEGAEEKKFIKQLRERLASNLASFIEMKKKERKHHKEEVRTDLSTSGVAKDAIKTKLKDLKEHELARISTEVETFGSNEEKIGGEELKKYRVQKLPLRHAAQIKQLEEELSAIKVHSEQRVQYRQAKIGIHNELIKRHLEEIHNTQLSLQEKRRNIETTQETLREKADLKNLQKQQTNDLKRHPKLLKHHELQMKKEYLDTVKSQTKIFKVTARQAVEALPKEQQSLTLKSKKAEELARLAAMEEQFKANVQQMADGQTEQLEANLKAQRAELLRELEHAMRQLSEFQAYRQAALHERHSKETAKLHHDIEVFIQQGRDFEAAEKLRVTMEFERLTKLKESCQKELTLLMDTPSTPVQFRT